ncbi:MAG: cytochrome c biogenesis protein CcsA [Saprospiraceae bacterium]|nr:cytochrome c biogenesis protein CcsA [Saprospiraceae bacterium]
MQIQGWWWKWLGVILIFYSLLVGLLVPLGPGITSVSPNTAKHGEVVEIKIEGYNTNFAKEGTKVWLKVKDRAIGADHIQVIDRRNMRASFAMPRSLPSKDTIVNLTLITYTPNDGHSVLPSALFVIGNDLSQQTSDEWKANIISTDMPASFHFPFRNILAETIRNTYYHVVLWFAMMIIFLISMISSVRHIRTGSLDADHKALGYASVGTLLGILGILTGAVWAKNTWGAYWSFDVKQNMSAIAMLIYAAYFILRQSISDPDLAKRFAAVYNIFAFCMLIPLLYIIPRMTDSLHPGSGGNPAFGSEDLDNTMRMVFYPAIIGWILFGCWMSNVTWRYLRIRDRTSP